MVKLFPGRFYVRVSLGYLIAAVVAGVSFPGCAPHWFHLPSQNAAAPLPVSNPLITPVPDHEFVWNQLVDTIDNYFKIAREDRVRVVGGVVTEGRIDTVPTVGATLFEPWRGDSASHFERLQSTLQPIRRRAEARVVPVSDGYSIEVAVFKELEDVSQPEHATVGRSTLRHDGSLVRVQAAPSISSDTLGWIPLGRDAALEQRILEELQGRLAVSPLEPAFATH